MRTLTLPDDKLTEVLAALEYSGSSEHTPDCNIRKTNHCSCHVEKAKAAYNTLRKAAQHVKVRAGDLQVGQLLVTTTETVRIVSVQKCGGLLPKVDVLVDFDDAGATPKETVTFGVNDQVTVFDVTV
jgi:hypothetical protein